MTEKDEIMVGMTRITRKGQITLLKEVREELGLEEGDKLFVGIRDRDREIVLRPVK